MPSLILAGIKEIFVPDPETLQNSVDAFIETIEMKFGFDPTFMTNLFGGEQPVQDINADYHIAGLGTFNFKFLDTRFLYDGVSYFRPFIRGFVVLLMAIYNIRMALGFIRQDSGSVAGVAVEASEDKRHKTVKGFFR